MRINKTCLFQAFHPVLLALLLGADLCFYGELILDDAVPGLRATLLLPSTNASKKHE